MRIYFAQRATRTLLLVIYGCQVLSCPCTNVSGVDLVLQGAGTEPCAAASLTSSGQLRLAPPSASPDTDLCLASLSSGRVAALACADADDGQRWAHNAFGDGTLINQLNPMQCLDVDGAGRPVLAQCTDPPQATQRWVVGRNGTVGTASPTGPAVLALASDGRCVASTAGTLSDPPCVLEGPIDFAADAPAPPPSAKLGSVISLAADLTLSAWVWAEDGNYPWGRILDLGNGAPSDNILLAFSGSGDGVRLVYQQYHGTSQAKSGSALLSSAQVLPLRQWVQVVVVHRGSDAHMLWRNTSNLSNWQEVGTAAIAPAASVVRTSNYVGVSNWRADPPFVGRIGGVAIFNRALERRELDGLSSDPTLPTAANITASGAVNLCATSAPVPPPAPAIRASLTLPTVASGLPTVEPELFGHDLEFTRHDLYEGFASEMLANRKFATPSPPLSKWPSPVQAMAAAGIGGAPRWTGIGAAKLDTPYWAPNSSSLVTGDMGHSVHCPAANADADCGVSQGGFFDGFDAGMSYGSSLDLQAGMLYTLRLVLLGSGASVSASLTSASDVRWEHTFPPLSADWQTFSVNFTIVSNVSNATLAITTTGTSEWWLGSASLTPVARNWRGMRSDVVAAVKQTGFRGLLRYPGGCFAPFYRWKVGLLPSDQRPPIETPPNYCAAVAGGVNAYTSGFMENGIGIDDYIALCEELGMVPAITVRLQVGDADEVNEARDWVEYCNGDAQTTKYGALRAARGHPEPYNVQYWYLGNEISQQARYPTYPANQTGLSPPEAAEYAAMLTRLVKAMEAASPLLQLRLLVVHAQWDATWLAAVGPHVFATSYHDGYYNQPVDFSAAAVTETAKAPLAKFVPGMYSCRQDLNKSGGAHVAISADEWGLGPPWKVSSGFSVAHGMYAAGFLGAITREGYKAGLQYSNYFEPVNEGAVAVGPFSAELTPVGRVMALYARHQDGVRLALPAAASGGDLDVVATLSNGVVRATVANLNAVGWVPIALELTLSPPPATGTVVSIDTLEATGFDKGSTFGPNSGTTSVGENGTFTISVPPFSVVQATLTLI